MSIKLPEYYFRVRENGALVFRVGSEDPRRPLDLQQIAVVNIRNDDVKPHGNHTLSSEDKTAIEKWMAERRQVLANRDIDDILRAVDHLKLTAQWAQSKASPEELEMITEDLLLAMHDLRTILVRKKADRLDQG